ncbi:MarR family winged helix-turn-helix transcriptional regulator [Aliikangiella coralliicola]|uniref:Winged helix-turn-helix transcriptional regulator n=1 Tax=Aliikangiella coralliicola TaxID=2592383 RepID=A0A545UF67_9GAMM|nr:MarR family winged helix-turn-helix transcriptional regulator [Aliikangiella coralliicola]TQV88117.1 winged helix-turn-helix transcriptional regulator [Aliikangiella coralliicola]
MNSNPIYNYVERLSELLRVDSRQAGALHGLQPVQLEALHYLSICNRYSDTPMAVTEYLGQTKGTVSQTLKVLERKSLLTKQPDENDKRLSHLKITAKGKQLLQQLVPTPMFNKACESLDKKDQAKIVSALNQLLATLLKTNGMKSFGVCHSCRFNSRKENGDYFCDLLKQPLSVDETELICREHEGEIA